MNSSGPQKLQHGKYARLPRRVGRSHLRILEALARYHFLVTEQIVELFYAPSSWPWVKQQLRTLRQHGLVERVGVPLKARGAPKSVFYLSSAGYRLIKELEEDLGLDLPARYRRQERQPENPFLLVHDLEITDFLIQMELLGRQRVDIAIANIIHDRDMQRRPIAIGPAGRRGRNLSLIPDGGIVLNHHAAGHVWKYVFLLEIDRAGHSVRAWKRKMRNYVTYITGGYHQERWGSDSLTVLIVATRGTGRSERLKAWTEEVLVECNADEEYDRFCFADLRPGEWSPEEIVFTPFWQQPFAPDPVALLVEGVA